LVPRGIKPHARQTDKADGVGISLVEVVPPTTAFEYLFNLLFLDQNMLCLELKQVF
jgi:hypothetical protein